jgi:hypothetical protein
MKAEADIKPLPTTIDRLEFAKNCTKLINEAIRTKSAIAITKDGEPFGEFRPV